MAQSASEANQHISRLHRHRKNVAESHAAIARAAAAVVAAHYDQNRRTGPDVDIAIPVASPQPKGPSGP